MVAEIAEAHENARAAATAASKSAQEAEKTVSIANETAKKLEPALGEVDKISEGAARILSKDPSFLNRLAGDFGERLTKVEARPRFQLGSARVGENLNHEEGNSAYRRIEVEFASPFAGKPKIFVEAREDYGSPFAHFDAFSSHVAMISERGFHGRDRSTRGDRMGRTCGSIGLRLSHPPRQASASGSRSASLLAMRWRQRPPESEPERLPADPLVLDLEEPRARGGAPRDRSGTLS